MKKEKIFIAVFMFLFVFVLGVTVADAASIAKEGVTMNYEFTLSGSKWNAYTYCYEDMDSKVSLFLYNKSGGTLLYSNIAYGRDRIPLFGTSATGTYASITKSNSSAKYGRSVHALLYQGQNNPYISAIELTKP